MAKLEALTTTGSTTTMTDMEPENPGPLLKYMRSRNADRIEQLTAERDRLQVALTRLLEPYEDAPCYYDHHGYCQAHFVEADCCVAYARAALKGETP